MTCIDESSKEIQHACKANEGKLVVPFPKPVSSALQTDSCLSNSTYESTLGKPALSYVALIAQAILSSPAKKLNLAAIYRYVEENFPFYRNRSQSWRNSIRHNLSLNDCFIKVGKCEDGKGNYWSIHPTNVNDFVHGDFKQHRKSHKRGQQKEYQAYLSTYLALQGECAFSTLGSLYQFNSYFSDPLQKMLCADQGFASGYKKWEASSQRKFSFLIQLDKAKCNPMDGCYGLHSSSAAQHNIFQNGQQAFRLLFFPLFQPTEQRGRRLCLGAHERVSQTSGLG